MIRNDDVVNEGFKPLRKNNSSMAEPTTLTHKPMNRGISFNAATGEKESSQTMWEGSTWEKMGRARGRTMDRSNSFVGGAPAKIDEIPKDVEGAIAVVDPFSTGAHLAGEARLRGYKCVRVLSAWDSPVASLVQEGVSIDFCNTIQHNDRMEEQEQAINDTVNSLRELPFPIIAVLPGAETGVELADQLSFRLGLRSNGTAQSLARRNKYVMGETVRNAGVRAVKQATCTSVEEMVAFLDTLRIPGSINNALKCVVKPVQSAGTDDVFLCQSVDEAVTAFDRIYGKVNGIGLMNDCVLVQEFLVGKEYVVDKVSKDGLHKLVAIWEYDKRRVNGANFVYFGMRLKPSDSEMAKVMIPYADKVLDALGIKNGPSHMEVMVNTIVENGVTRYDPCLVEVGARCHGGEGTWLPVAKECVGYNQVMVTLDAYLDCKLFDSIQKDYFPVHKAGREVDMVSRYGGIVRALPGDAAIRKLPSFRSISWEVKPGDYCHKTIDCFTRPGCVQLVAATEADAERDLEAIHDLELFGLIDYAVICPKPPTVGAIVVVDPFSTGAHLAALVLKWGYKLILVFSQLEGHVSNLVAKGNHVNPTLLIQHDSKNANIDAAMAETLAKIESEGSPVLAIISGAESGVTLAGNLALKFGTRANEILDIHTNKHAMQEAVSKVGVRSVDQRLCKNEDEVVSFLAHLKEKTGSTKAVMKPAQSVGADHVTLCSTQGDAVSALHSINGQINQLGNVNDGALLQEYLQGTEFVVDGISRDGVYKIVAIWEYDKRSINGAHFVHFGMRLRDGHDSQLKPLLDYAHKVVTVLKIFQGPTHMKLRLQTNVKEGTIHYDPCLISIGAHCHGGDGTWIPIANECIGYNQVEMTLGCYVRPDRFDSLPAVPRLLFHGSEAFLVAHENGTIHDIPGLDRIRSLSSFRRCELLTQPGAHIKPTVDYFTRPGSVQLVNKNAERLDQDYQLIHTLEREGLFELL